MYRIIIRKKAKKFIDKLPRNERLRIAKAIEMLPNGEDIKKLRGRLNIPAPVFIANVKTIKIFF